jgi:hypothetical protein
MADLQPLLPRKILPMPPIGDAPPIANVGGMGGGMPMLPPISPLPVTADPRASSISSDPLITRESQLDADLYKRTNPVKPTTTLGKIGHVAANVGNVLGDIFAPDVMANIPGTQLYNERIEKRDKADLQANSQLQTEEAGRKQQAATTAYETARPQIEEDKVAQKLTSTLGKVGLVPVRDENGKLTGETEDDPNSPASESRHIHDDVEQSRQALQDAEAQVKLASNDPNSPTYKLAITRASIARANASAAITRAQAYYGNYLQHAFNKDLSGNVLPGAPQIEDAAGNTTTVGSTNAPQAVKAQANAAQFGDVGGALDNLEAKAKALVASGGKLNSPSVVYALQHAGGTPSELIQSLDKAGLTPEERDYVISNLAAHENVQALRKSAGGTATDSSVAKLDALLPSGATPDIDYLLNQTGQIRQTAARLGKGVTTVQGGLKVGDQKPHKVYNPKTGRIE